EDYYAGRGEAAGHWVGRGAAAAGLDGDVSGQQLARLFEALHPDTGEALGAAYKVRDGADQVRGWDLTFSAPKSLSVLWAIGGGEVGMVARECHDAAVATALEYLEEHAAFSRKGKAGIRQVDTEGLLGAAFVHRTSRAGDPQLHTHVLVSGRVRCEDRVWRALDSRALHRELKPGGVIYQAALRAESEARLGVVWGPVDRNGQADIIGVPEGLLTHYSKRRQALEGLAKARIAESEAVLGRSLTAEERRRAYERATLETRLSKAHPEASDQGLHDRWLADASDAGFVPEQWLAEVLDRRGPEHQMDAGLAYQGAVVTECLAELGRSSSTWSRRHVVQQVVRRAPAGLGGAGEARHWVEQVADEVLSHPTVVRLAAPAPEAPSDLCRRDGLSVYEAHGAPRFSTLATLAREQEVLEAAVAGREAQRAMAQPQDSEVAIALHGLDADQAEAVRRLTLDGEAIACLIGPAGAGKSRTMGAAAEAWCDRGFAVRGLAVSAAAAGVLQAEAGIASETIAKFLFEHDRPGGREGRWRLGRDEVVVIDEAAMASSLDLARVVALATEAQAKVVLVGDHRQLGAVEAGGLFRLLAAEIDAAELTGVRRFHALWEREASLRLRDGDKTVIGDYLQHGRVVGGDREVMVEEAFVRWELTRARGDSVVVCAADHATVDELAARARAARVAAGEVEAEGVVAGEQVVGVGDEIVTCRNDRRLVTSGGGWVRNGDRWQVLARQADEGLLVEDMAGRGRVVLPSEYVRDDVALAYAVTIHKAQGLTVDKSILLVDEATTAEGLYVGMTRGRTSNVALAVCDDAETEHQPAGPARSETEVVLAAMSRSAAEVAALQALREAFARSESLATLAPRLANLNAQLARETPPDRSKELRWATEALERARSTCRPGHLTQRGREDRRRLEVAEACYDELVDHALRRQAWLDAHADTLNYRDDLAEAVANRRHELGVTAAITQPDHVVDLIGAVPTGGLEATRTWIKRASWIESYREEWGVEPERLRERPLDACQGQEWDRSVHLAEVLARPPLPTMGRSLDRGVDQGIELGW
ncbi:MAG: relaxase domain-containing protein, partial [Actinomycetota bacterium]|nr:relaxase domain-containing protein [Actinomycetota bacterium]